MDVGQTKGGGKRTNHMQASERHEFNTEGEKAKGQLKSDIYD